MSFDEREINVGDILHRIMRTHTDAINTLLSKTFKTTLAPASVSRSLFSNESDYYGLIHFQADVSHIDPVRLFQTLQKYCEANNIFDSEHGWPSARKIKKYTKSGKTPRLIFEVRIPRQQVEALAKLEEL